MSFNQISGKINDRKPQLRRGERKNSNKTTILYRRDANMISQNNSFRDFSLNDQHISKEDSKFCLPSNRRESLGKIEKINIEKFNQKSKFFTEVELQENTAEEKALSSVLESKIFIKMPKKLSLNSWQQRVKQKQQSIIFNYLNEKMSPGKPKKRKKKKKLLKSAQKLEKIDKLYVFPKSDPRIHRRQMTEFKLKKSPRINILQPHQKRKSLHIDRQKQLFALRRQTQTFKKQTKLLEELKRKVAELERSQGQESIEKKISNRKFELSNRKIESMSLVLNVNQIFQAGRKESVSSNRTNRTIEKTPKHGRESFQRKQSFRRITQVPIDLIKKSQEIQRELNLAQTIKLDELHREENSSSYQPSRKNSFSSNNQNLRDARIHKESSEEFEQTESKIDDSNENQNKIEEKDFLILTRKSKKKHPSRIPDKSFLHKRTYYAETSQNPKLIDKTISLIQPHSIALKFKTLPSKEDLTSFLQNYIPQNPNIKISSLIKMKNFEVILQENQQLYFGQIFQGKKFGYGVTIRHNYLYEGTYKDGQKIEGLEVNEVGKYFGEFKNNKKHGHGQFLWKNGQTYDGQWINGKKHGQGTWSSPNGDVYEGSWVNGKVQGQGIHISSSGQKYEGSFHQFLKSGWGNEMLPNGDIYQGLFANGKPNGQGTYTWSDGNIYKGEFFEGFRHGIGTFKDFRGNKYHGKFEKQEASGECEIKFGNQDSFSGEVKEGRFNGFGTLILYQQQEIMKGFWLQDKFIQEKEEIHY